MILVSQIGVIQFVDLGKSIVGGVNGVDSLMLVGPIGWQFVQIDVRR